MVVEKNVDAESEEEELEEKEGCDGGEEDKDKEEAEEGGGIEKGGSDGGEENEGNGSIFWTLTKPVLDCIICHLSLTIPVFQCQNGHLACSNCSTKQGNKCSSCPLPQPLSNVGCKAIEKVLRSAKVSCQNTSYGCKKVMSYGKKQEHEPECTYSPCSCPFSDCDFIGKSTKLSRHFNSKNLASVNLLLYDLTLPIPIETNDSSLVLKEANESSLSMINSFVQAFGTAVTVTCLGFRLLEERFAYDLTAKAKRNCIRITSAMVCIQSRMDNPPPVGFLMVPCGFLGSDSGSKELKLYLCIRPVDHFLVRKDAFYRIQIDFSLKICSSELVVLDMLMT